jgi:hypothetical protein
VAGSESPEPAIEPQSISVLVQAAHAHHVASLTDAELTSTLVDEQDTRETWPVTMWGGTHTVTHPVTPDDLDPEDIVGWIA